MDAAARRMAGAEMAAHHNHKAWLSHLDPFLSFWQPSPMKPSLTRREALQTAGTLLLASAIPSLPAAPARAKRVVIVGGGIAGL